MTQFTGHPEDYESPEPPCCLECTEPLDKDAMGFMVCVNSECEVNEEEQ